jgi:FkbH-like protein
MRLAEALQILAKPAGAQQRDFHLLCGFEPLHLATFLKAHLRLRFPSDAVSLQTGLYGDLEGNIQRAAQKNAEGAIVVIEWGDLDQRLSFRNSSGWAAQTLDDIAGQAQEKCRRIETHLAALAQAMPVSVIAPTLALPPITYLPPAQTSTFELRLNALLIDFLGCISKFQGIKVLNASTLAINSPPSARHDVKTELVTGFPYTLTHTDALAQLSVSCLFPAAGKKGLITDLDQTLWKGILGDAGVNGVSWSLEDKSQAHALYQQLLASLAESGVLIAIASKNDPKLVEAALQRTDILIQPSQIFPVEAGWGAKSEAVARILKAWNIGADSVVFVDDSPMELAEVSEKFPAMECLPFPSADPAAIVALLQLLRHRFGKETIREEDRLRLESLRVASEFRQHDMAEASPDFLSRLEAKITFHTANADEARALELVNKTNQFNLNGIRYTEAEWKVLQNRPGAFLTTVSYKDRFGPLGRIAVFGGYFKDEQCIVDIWVMSCRAFSRQIEFQSLKQLFAKSNAPSVRFLFKPTERNGPLQTFFAHLFLSESLSGGELTLTSEAFEKSCPTLFQEVIENG